VQNVYHVGCNAAPGGIDPGDVEGGTQCGVDTVSAQRFLVVDLSQCLGEHSRGRQSHVDLLDRHRRLHFLLDSAVLQKHFRVDSRGSCRPRQRQRFLAGRLAELVDHLVRLRGGWFLRSGSLTRHIGGGLHSARPLLSVSHAIDSDQPQCVAGA